VLQPVAARLGVQFERFERHGYARLELFDVRLAAGSSVIHAKRVEMAMPHRWLWVRWTGAAGAEPQITVDAWQVAPPPISRSTADGAGLPTSGVVQSSSTSLDAAQALLPTLGAWMRFVVLTHGEVQLPGRHLAISRVQWLDETLTADLSGSRGRVDCSALSEGTFSLSVSNEIALVDIDVARNRGVWGFQGGVHSYSNQFDVVGQFGHDGWYPSEASIGSDTVVLAHALPGLPGPTEMRGSAHARWTNDTYSFTVDLRSASTRNRQMPGLLAVRAAGGGDLEALRLDQLQLTSPGMHLSLNEPVTVAFTGRVDAMNAPVTLWADLSRMTAIPVEGQLSGRVTVYPATFAAFRAGFTLQGTNVAGAGLHARSLTVAGELDWPVLEVARLEADFDSGGQLTGRLSLDLEQQHVKESSWMFEGPWPTALPPRVQLESLQASGSVQGTWPSLVHDGTVEVVGLEATGVRVASSHVRWRGEHLRLDSLAVHLESGASSVDLTGQGGLKTDADGLSFDGALEELDLRTPNGSLGLNAPVQLQFRSRTNGYALELSTLELTGSDRALTAQASIQWPTAGTGCVSLHGLRSSDFWEFFTPDLPRVTVPRAVVEFAWGDGPLTFELSGGAEWRFGGEAVWTAHCKVTSDGQTLSFDPARIDLNDSPAVMMTGHLPLSIKPGRGWSVGGSANGGPAAFDLNVVEGGPLWSLAQEYAGVQVDSPALSIQLRGDAPEMHGRLSFRAGALSLTRTNTLRGAVLPSLEDLTITLQADLDGLELEEGSASLLGQRIEAQAAWPVTATDWVEWLDVLRACDLQQVSGRLRMTNAAVSRLSAVASDLIAPVGTLDVDLKVHPGLQVVGHVVMDGMATRFLRPVGALRNIEATLLVHGWNATLERATALLGGQPVNLEGEVEWRPDGDRRFDLQLTGENLSLIRDPDLFLRADLDVHLQKAFGQTARLAGDVQLQHSLLFRDFSMLVGSNVQRPDQRPPYFSIPRAPFGDWELDLSLRGDRFLHVVSPAFKGEVSTGLQLLGTLREPFTVGTVTVDKGKVLFPFGMVEVENGRVELSREDPYRPWVDFRAVGQNFGYTVTVKLRGPYDAPNLTFQSVPPLTAQQILLMLSAGEVPRSDFSYDTSDKASQVGFYIGKEFVNRFIGNTASSERLFFRSGEHVTDEGTPTYAIEYRFTERWSVFGEYNRFRDFNSGLKLKVLSK
jgi:translocation and assembly module TamB